MFESALTATITACKFTAVSVKAINVYEGNMGVAPPNINLYIDGTKSSPSGSGRLSSEKDPRYP